MDGSAYQIMPTAAQFPLEQAALGASLVQLIRPLSCKMQSLSALGKLDYFTAQPTPLATTRVQCLGTLLGGTLSLP